VEEDSVVEDLAAGLAVDSVEEDSVVEGMVEDLAVGLVEEDSVVEDLAVDLAVGLVEVDSVVEEEDSAVDSAVDSVVDSVAMEVDSADSVVDSAAAYIDISTVRVSLSIPPPSSSILSIFSPRQFPRFDLQLLSLRLISFSPINCSRSRLHTRLFLHSCETYSHRYAFLDRLSIRE
jgi:Flp pilus assembly CpaF family ATPase